MPKSEKLEENIACSNCGFSNSIKDLGRGNSEIIAKNDSTRCRNCGSFIHWEGKRRRK